MTFANIVRGILRFSRGGAPPLEPAVAYDLWSSTYDTDTGNLLIDVDESMFGGLLERVLVKGRVVADVGCGTGRHWAKILAQNPAELLGFDVSPRMLAKLSAKYPKAVVHQVSDHRLLKMPAESCDLLVSTLALGHLRSATAAIAEWARVLKPGGDIIITDLHPESAAGARCTFQHNGRVLAIKLYAHPLVLLREAAIANGLSVERLDQSAVETSHRPYYEAKNAAVAFHRLKGVPLIFGLHLKKPDSPGQQ